MKLNKYLSKYSKNIINFPNYHITKSGRIINRKTGKERKQVIVKGYLGADFRNGLIQKSFRTHRLVALAYIKNHKNKPQVNHIDGNKLNNDISNLEWVTASENIQHAYDTGLSVSPKGTSSPNYGMRNGGTSKPVICIDVNGDETFYPSGIEAVRLGAATDKMGVSDCINGKRKKHNKKTWRLA